MTLVLREGYDAMAAAAVDAGCRFFAGYPMLPFTGLLDAFARELPRTDGVWIQADTEIEGANMALEDAWLLARCLTELDSDTAAASAALSRFVALRRPRTTRRVRGAADNTTRFHNSLLADPATAAAYIDREWEPARVRQRYDWLFEHDVTCLPLDMPP